MSNFQFHKLSETRFLAPESPQSQDIEEHLDTLRRSHALRYQILNLETWALVSTTDNLFPGFWGRFMSNRQVALREFLERKKAQQS